MVLHTVRTMDLYSIETSDNGIASRTGKEFDIFVDFLDRQRSWLFMYSVKLDVTTGDDIIFSGQLGPDRCSSMRPKLTVYATVFCVYGVCYLEAV